MRLKNLITKFGDVFTLMETFGELPWQNEKYSSLFSDIMSEDVDFALVDKFGNLRAAYEDDEIDQTYFDKLIKSIYRRSIRKWNAIAETYCQEYNMIENYDRYEDLSSTTNYNGSETNKRTDDLTQTDGFGETTTTTKSGTESSVGKGADETKVTYANADKNTRSGNEVLAMKKDSNTLNQASVFDSNYLTDNSKSIDSGTDTNTTTYNSVTDDTQHSGTVTTDVSGNRGIDVTFDNRKDEVARTGENSTKNTGTQTSEKTFTDRNDKTIGDNHIHGNIGVTTAQQMITAERELWLDDYYNYVFSDVLKELTIPYY